MVAVREDFLELVELAEVSAELSGPSRRAERDRLLAERVNQLLRAKLDRASHSVSKIVAARFLQLSDETITSWLRRGILRPGTDAGTPKETVEFESLRDVGERITRLKALDVTDKTVWAKLLAAGLGEGGRKFSTEDIEIMELNRHSRGRGLILPDLRRRAGR